MNFQFCFNGTPIEPSEAVALLEATSGKDRNGSIIDISNFIDSKNLDANKLFELSVSSKNQGLASLAWKISIQQSQAKPSSGDTQNIKAIVAPSNNKTNNLEDIIEHLNSTTSYTALGVALILNATKDKEWVTLRGVASDVVNEILSEKLHLTKSKFFRGFESQGGVYTPLDLSSGHKRKYTFHVSPLYISLREGLVYCKTHGLVEQKKLLSTGAPYAKNSSPSADSTRRLYYKIKASERGHELIKLWADLDRYIEKTIRIHQ